MGFLCFSRKPNILNDFQVDFDTWNVQDKNHRKIENDKNYKKQKKNVNTKIIQQFLISSNTLK